MTDVPDFDNLPKVKDMPQGTAWGIFDKDGKKDVYGTLNFLTPDVVKEAVSEAKEGIHVSLNWPIGAIKTPLGRKGLVHKVIDYVDSPLNCHGYDDEVEFNTQCSSQWDSLCHFHHQPSASGYNGTKTSVEALTDQDTKQQHPTLDHWHKRGGMVARGVLIDFKRYADETGRRFSSFEADRITVQDIETVAKRQGVEFKPGDVLIIRSGFTEDLENISGERQLELISGNRVCGVTGDIATARWIWNHKFAAVAGDMIAFEQIPSIVPEEKFSAFENLPAEGGREGQIGEMVLHQYLLGLFGMSIGELWDLKALSETCARLNRYSFLLTSIPLNVPGLIGSPPNAIAIF